MQDKKILISHNVKRGIWCEATTKSPLERGAALAAGCVISLRLLFSTPFYNFPGIFLLRKISKPFRINPNYEI